MRTRSFSLAAGLCRLNDTSPSVFQADAQQQAVSSRRGAGQTGSRSGGLCAAGGLQASEQEQALQGTLSVGLTIGSLISILPPCMLLQVAEILRKAQN